jgi:hypothetical protein
MRAPVVWFVGTCVVASSFARAQAVINGGFESPPVGSGQFIRAPAGWWQYTNDAGVVRPFGRSTGTQVFNTWSATRAAFEGAQYASTYAGSDAILQPVVFDQSGAYELSVMAFSPAGTQEIPGNPGLFMPLEAGEFGLQFAGAQVGPTWVVPAGSDWTRYATTVDVAQPGTYVVGVANTRSAVYFVNYDAFSVTPVPEPSAAGVALTIGAATVFRRRRLTTGAGAQGRS